LYTFCIWSFAENPEGAKRFLVDYTASLREAVLASGFNTMPTFPDAVPDLAGWSPVMPVMARQAGTACWPKPRVGRPTLAIRVSPTRRSARSTIEG
jgi:hypothetical protein